MMYVFRGFLSFNTRLAYTKAKELLVRMVVEDIEFNDRLAQIVFNSTHAERDVFDIDVFPKLIDGVSCGNFVLAFEEKGVSIIIVNGKITVEQSVNIREWAKEQYDLQILSYDDYADGNSVEETNEYDEYVEDILRKIRVKYIKATAKMHDVKQ